MQVPPLNNQFIYNEVQTVILKNKPNEERNCSFRISVESKINHTTRLLNVKVTDDVDYTFLFTLLLTQEDFLSLKAQQGLRVDFESFHKQFTKLLADCSSPEKPQFALMLDDSDSHGVSSSPTGGLYLKVIERNDFKYLCHLSLRLAPASDDDIRQHLCSKLKLLQDQTSAEKIKSEQLTSELAQYAELLSQKNQIIKEFEVRHAKDTSSIRLECSQEISNERTKHNSEIVAIEAKHHAAVYDLQEQIRLLTYKNTAYHEEKCALQSSVKEVTLLYENANKEVNRLHLESTDLRSTINTLDHKVKTNDQRLDMAQRRIAALETSDKESAATLAHVRREVQVAKERESAATSNFSRCQRQLHHTIDQLEHITKDKERIHQELDIKKNKFEKMLLVATRLEEDLQIARSECDEKDKKLLALEEDNKHLRNSLDAEQKKLNEAEKNLTLKEETLKKQIDVNAYLNRKLNDATTAQTMSKNASLSTSAAANLYPCSVNGTIGDSIRQNTNRSQAPWLTSNGITASSMLSDQASTLQPGERQIRLDPSYLFPADADVLPKTTDAKLKRSKESSYFPKRS